MKKITIIFIIPLLILSLSSNVLAVKADGYYDNDYTNSNNKSLHRTIYLGNEIDIKNAIIKWIKEGNDINEKNTKFGETPLMVALAYNNNPEIIKLLIDAGADINKKNYHGESTLSYAFSNQKKEVLNILLNVNDINSYNLTKDEKVNLLDTALTDNNNLEAIKVIINFIGEKFIHINKYEEDPLLIRSIVNNNNPKVVNYLIDLGVDTNITGEWGVTPLFWAAAHQNTSVIDNLISKGSNVNFIDSDGWNALMMASRYNKRIEMVDYLLDKGNKINHINSNKTTPFLLAASEQNVKYLKYLLNKGANLKHTDANNWNALMMAAAYNDNIEVIKYLLKNDFEIDDRNNSGKTALILAAENNSNGKIISYLLDQGADKTITDNSGNTAYDYIKDNYNFEDDNTVIQELKVY